jgi:hypothetical protein
MSGKSCQKMDVRDINPVEMVPDTSNQGDLAGVRRLNTKHPKTKEIVGLPNGKICLRLCLNMLPSGY